MWAQHLMFSKSFPQSLSDTFVLRLYIKLLLLFYFMREFHTSIRLWSFTGVWETANLLKSPGMFSVFWLMLPIGWSLLFLRFPTFLTPYKPFGDRRKGISYNWHLCHLCASELFQFSYKVHVLVYLLAFIYFHSVILRKCKVHKFVDSI